ncbi:nucleotidyltransferase family protein [Micrococcus luteus]|uniref:nucleotidyltransferase family protein n=1 Tax=Micrococcus luteus TaxID=1270 RepID=UPI0033A101E6|nr:nucleotidyltransferase family protein [Micrococcus luteus]
MGERATGPRPAAPPSLDFEVRVRLAHARIAHLLDRAGIRALHLKGYATEPGVYPDHRRSSDVDLLVHPSDAAAVALLASHGWAPVADFSEGSIFEHAATLWHDHLGYVDVHRLFPGLGTDAARTFDALWAERVIHVIAGRPVPVPGPVHQRLVVIVHAARDSHRGALDVRHIRDTSSPAEWDALRQEARRLHATAAWHVATGEEADGMDAHDLALFEALQADESGLDLFRTRWRTARSARERARLVLHTLPVNRPHLQMRLGRPVTRADLWREQGARLGALAGWAWTKAVRRDR